MKFEKALNYPVTLTLEVDDIFFLRGFLYEERISAEIDLNDIENLHNGRARQAARQAINHEHATITRIINAMDATLGAAEVRGVIAEKIASLNDALQADGEVTAAKETDE